MSIRNTLNRLVRVVIAEAEKNAAFNAALTEALCPKTNREDSKTSQIITSKKRHQTPKRSQNRRSPAVFDPVLLVKNGIAHLRDQLQVLSLEQLRDVIAEYGMDPGNKAMRWKDTAKVVEFILEIAHLRESKGDAFRE